MYKIINFFSVYKIHNNSFFLIRLQRKCNCLPLFTLIVLHVRYLLGKYLSIAIVLYCKFYFAIEMCLLCFVLYLFSSDNSSDNSSETCNAEHREQMFKCLVICVTEKWNGIQICVFCSMHPHLVTKEASKRRKKNLMK